MHLYEHHALIPTPAVWARFHVDNARFYGNRGPIMECADGHDEETDDWVVAAQEVTVVFE